MPNYLFFRIVFAKNKSYDLHLRYVISFILHKGYRSLTGEKRSGHGVDHPPLSSAEVKERVEVYLYSPSGPSLPVLGRTFILPLLVHGRSKTLSSKVMFYDDKRNFITL